MTLWQFIAMAGIGAITMAVIIGVVAFVGLIMEGAFHR